MGCFLPVLWAKYDCSATTCGMHPRLAVDTSRVSSPYCSLKCPEPCMLHKCTGCHGQASILRVEDTCNSEEDLLDNFNTGRNVRT